MKRLLLLFACLLHISGWAQLFPPILPPQPPQPPFPSPAFVLDFGTNPPSCYIGGASYFAVSDYNLHFNMGYFTVPATDAWLMKRQADGSLLPGFRMYPQTAALVGFGLVYSYTPGFPIMGNSAIQVADFRAGLWYMRFQFGSGTYTGQLVPTPDTTPPQILSMAATPRVLWPPDHRLVPVNLAVQARDDRDPSPAVRIAQVTSNEPEHPLSPDWEITGPQSLNLRAERLGKGEGRVYTIVVECEDASGNTSSASITVSVPHDQEPSRVASPPWPWPPLDFQSPAFQLPF